MSNITNQEKIIETKSCKICNLNFKITDKDLEFLDKISPKFNGEKFTIPTSTLCSDCRQQRILSIRNESNLYKRKCDAIGNNIISIFKPDNIYTVYDNDYRWSDKWDIMNYGIEINFNDSFFNQFKNLILSMPKRALIKGLGSENCDYVNGVGSSKNCYLVFTSVCNNNCYFSNNIDYSTNCMDSSFLKNCENCYELVDSDNCYQVFWSQNCLDCSNSQYLFNCKGCSNCFGCVNLSNKEYYIFNEKFTKYEYIKKIEKINSEGYSINKLNKFKKKFPNINLIIINSENASGDKIYNSNNIFNSFEINDSDNIKNSLRVFKNCSYVYNTYTCLNNSNYIYESSVINNKCHNLIFCNDCWSECIDLIYCTECKNCKNCFLCTGLREKEYCILNKQYSKEEYEKLVPKIINHMKNTGEWGEFFPATISPFGYNETVAQEYFPLIKEEDISLGFKWSDYESSFPKVEKIIHANKLPENIKEIPDDILNWAIECEITKKPFKIISKELEFYRKYNLPIPRKHPDQRHKDRIKLRNPRKIFDRKCDKCGIDIKTTYNPNKEEMVYCEECYNKEIY